MVWGLLLIALSANLPESVRTALPQSFEAEVRLRQVSGADTGKPLPLKVLKKAARGQLANFNKCLLSDLSARREGVVRLKMAVDSSGSVTGAGATSEQLTEDFLTCLEEASSDFRFPRHRSSSRLTVYLSVDTTLVHAAIREIALRRERARRAELAKLTTFYWPTKKHKINSKYGHRWDPLGMSFKPVFHTGVDLAAKWGSPIRASAAGVVRFAEWRNGRGKEVVLEHRGGLRTGYGHLSTILVRPGQRVQAGQIVGRAGSTGKSTGPHLHFEVTMPNKKKINPMLILGKSVNVNELVAARFASR